MTSIRARLLVALLAMFALVALVLAGFTYRNVLLETQQLFDYQLRQMALSLRDQGEIDPGQAQALADEQLDFVVQIWRVDGRSIYATRDHKNLPSRALLGLADITVNGQTWRTFSVASRDRVIQVAQPAQIRQRLAADAALRGVAPLLFLAPLVGLAAWWLVSVALKPLRRVADEVHGRGERLLSPLPVDGLPDEVSPMVLALNALLGRLDEAFNTQRAFVADAAHELRSPLTALKLQLQLLQRADDVSTRDAALAALAAGIDRAARLVEQLLTLARSEPGAPSAPRAPLDLAEVVRQALADTVPFALARGTDLVLRADEPVPWQGNATELGALARNLADNAVRYSPPGAHVVVQVRMAQGSPVIEVDDNGPGIAREDRERVFDRFHRRTGTDEAGSGLGLAIVQSIARRQGAQVGLEESPLGGLRATVRFSAPA
ncbi:MAG: hypothetical protein RLZZ618_3586 [Pseudomonadota bacterium]|jgi:two-component system OmpR family sensor kinase/two-component system sensor histidine kinase QseC